MPGWTEYSMSTPNFLVDQRMGVLNSGRQVDWSRVPDTYTQDAQTVTANGAAAAAATSITVDALTAAIPSGTTLRWGSGEFATLTAPAAAGATTLTVEALVNGIEDNDAAIIGGTGGKVIPAGTVMSELTSGATIGQLVPRAARPGSEPATCILATPAVEQSRAEALTGYGCYVGGIFYENMLPDATGTPAVLPPDYKTELEAAGLAFAWEQYSDSMA